MRYGSRLVAALVLPAIALAFSARNATAQTPPGHATVFWVSVDGFRHDYVAMDHPPFLTKMMHEGAYSTHMQTIFPSLTFPSHVAEETGTTVDHHGVPANDFYDRVTKKIWAFPPDGSMLNAEPIWITATRQGVRTDVFDWPLSQMEKGPNAAAYSNPDAFNAKLNPQQRMDQVVDAYEKDQGDPPVRLMMAYMEPVDHAGHSKGPESPETADAVLKADAVLQKTFDRVSKDFEAKRKSPDDVLYFLMTTDHGMTTVKTLVRLDFILNLPPETGTRRGGRDEAATAPATAPATQPGWPGGGATHRDVTVVTSGPLGNVYLPKTLSPEERETRIAGYLKLLRAKPYLRAYRQEELPAEWAYRNADRIGDIVVILNEPYTFSNRIPEAEYPVEKGERGGGVVGMHGYEVAGNPDMEGFTCMWRSKGNWGGKDLGIVHSTQFHATVARWLGIQPSSEAGPPISGTE